MRQREGARSVRSGGRGDTAGGRQAALRTLLIDKSAKGSPGMRRCNVFSTGDLELLYLILDNCINNDGLVMFDYGELCSKLC